MFVKSKIITDKLKECSILIKTRYGAPHNSDIYNYINQYEYSKHVQPYMNVCATVNKRNKIIYTNIIIHMGSIHITVIRQTDDQ